MFSELFVRFKWKHLAASVRGPGHIKDDMPNQDSAFVGFVGSFLLVMVCDGLGSHLHSDFGAQTLGKVFPKCFREWSQYRPNQLDDFLRLMKCRWLMQIRRFGVEACGCTCQCAVLNSKGKGWLLQLGDGMTLVKHDSRVEKFTEIKEGFGNETQSMIEGNLLPSWRRN